MKAKIMIVEDHEPIRNELKILLSKYGYEIIALDRFDTVVEDCLREDVDLILLDINLPFYDGYYVCRTIREKSEVPIIVVTSRDSEMDELMSINLGADDFVTKPYNTQILLARISAMLKRTQKETVNDSLQYKGLKLQLNNSTVIYKDHEIELSKNKKRAGLYDMKTKDLFRMEYAQILIYIVFLGLLEVLLFIFEVNYFLMIYLLLIGLILEGVYLCQRYMKKYRYYKKVKAKLDILEQKCMITEMLELPDFAEGEFLYEILQTCNKSMNDEILKYKIEAAGYREYIEMWIHEVKTPLAATRLILENHPSEITRAMDEEMQQINYYLEQALYYARSNSVEKDYLVKELSLKEVVENAVKANAKSLIGNKIKIKIENLDQKIFSDEKWVLFILNQVISNAIKYKKEEAEISFCARCEKNEILLEIRDNGIGISPKDLPRITDKGYTGTTGRNYQKSTGMGLYLCKKLCSKLQLSFYIESKEEEYTKVTIGFPRNSMIFLNEE